MDSGLRCCPLSDNYSFLFLDVIFKLRLTVNNNYKSRIFIHDFNRYTLISSYSQDANLYVLCKFLYFSLFIVLITFPYLECKTCIRFYSRSTEH